MVLASTRSEIADFLSALLGVYVICLIGWIVVSLVLSLGVRLPYNRFVNAVIEFLRDVAEPYLRIFRRLPLQVGPLDLSPMVAIFVLYLVGGVLIGLVDDRQ